MGFIFYGRRVQIGATQHLCSARRTQVSREAHIAQALLVHVFKEHAGRVACGFSCLGGSRDIICCSRGASKSEQLSLAAAVYLQLCAYRNRTGLSM